MKVDNIKQHQKESTTLINTITFDTIEKFILNGTEIDRKKRELTCDKCNTYCFKDNTRIKKSYNTLQDCKTLEAEVIEEGNKTEKKRM